MKKPQVLIGILIKNRKCSLAFLAAASVSSLSRSVFFRPASCCSLPWFSESSEPLPLCSRKTYRFLDHVVMRLISSIISCCFVGDV